MSGMNRHQRRKQVALGFKNDHHLIQEKVIPESLVMLRGELAEPFHAWILSKAARESTFEASIGQIAACLNIALDGMYEAADLFEVLYDALKARRLSGNYIPPGSIGAELQEDKEGNIQLTENWLERLGKNRETSVVDAHSLMMLEAGCDQCDNRAACRAAGKCLGDDSRAEEGDL